MAFNQCCAKSDQQNFGARAQKHDYASYDLGVGFILILILHLFNYKLIAVLIKIRNHTNMNGLLLLYYERKLKQLLLKELF